MVTVSRNTTDLTADERIVIERLVGTHLTENQRIVVQVLDAEGVAAARPRVAADYAILADLDDAEADLLTEAMTERSPGRDTPLWQ
jgi:hypothetical protein